MIREIWAYLTGGTLVVLEDFQGDCYETIAYKNAFGKMTARVFWFTCVGRVVLRDDGTCYGQSSYIERWTKG